MASLSAIAQCGPTGDTVATGIPKDDGTSWMEERVTGAAWLVGQSALAALVCSGQVNAREVVAAHLDRIGQVNAVTQVLATMSFRSLSSV